MQKIIHFLCFLCFAFLFLFESAYGQTYQEIDYTKTQCTYIYRGAELSFVMSTDENGKILEPSYFVKAKYGTIELLPFSFENIQAAVLAEENDGERIIHLAGIDLQGDDPTPYDVPISLKYGTVLKNSDSFDSTYSFVEKKNTEERNEWVHEHARELNRCLLLLKNYAEKTGILSFVK
jgi:hypothetical protein